jgi:SAM-dependent methyltransferase
MKAMWNARAKADATFYVESHYTEKIDSFYGRGEHRTRLLLDPVLPRLGVDPKRLHALEIGCGLGRFARALSIRFAQVTAVDVSDEMIARAERANQEHGNIAFRATDGERLPLASQTIDFVFSYEVFQHMPTHEVIQTNLREISRVLKPQGLAMIHFRTGGWSVRLLYVAAGMLPSWLHAGLKRIRGKRPLTSDASWRGAAPLSHRQIEMMAQKAALTVADFIEDPTHAPGTRIFALLGRGVDSSGADSSGAGEQTP